MPSYFVVEEADINGETSETRWRVTPLTMSPTWITAANDLITATFGAGLLSLGGVDEAYYTGDIITTAVPAQPNTDVRSIWQLNNQVLPDPIDRQNITCPNLTNNIVPGSFIQADLASTAWTAYTTAVEATDFGWIDNDGTANQTVVGAVQTVRHRKPPRTKSGGDSVGRLGGHMVVKVVDSQGEHAEFRVRVTSLGLTSAWVTAANAVLAATYGATAISGAGYNRAFYRHDFLSAPIAAQPNTSVRNFWRMLSEGTGNPVSWNNQIPIRNLTGNIADGSETRANLSSPNWAAFITALKTANLGWVGNDGQTVPNPVSAVNAARSRRRRREVNRLP